MPTAERAAASEDYSVPWGKTGFSWDQGSVDVLIQRKCSALIAAEQEEVDWFNNRCTGKKHGMRK